MRLFVKFIILVVILGILLPISPIAVVAGAVIGLYVIEYWRAKNLALNTMLKEKYVNARQKLRARIEREPKQFTEGVTEEEALELDEFARDLEEETIEAAELDQISDSWIAKAERRRAMLRRALWRFATAPFRRLAHLVLNLTEGEKRD